MEEDVFGAYANIETLDQHKAANLIKVFAIH